MHMYIYIYIYVFFYFSFYLQLCDILQDFINSINVDVDVDVDVLSDPGSSRLRPYCLSTGCVDLVEFLASQRPFQLTVTHQQMYEARCLPLLPHGVDSNVEL